MPLVDLLRPLGRAFVTTGMSLAIWLAFVAATLLCVYLFSRHEILPEAKIRPAFWFTYLNPFLLYHVVVFGQVDIFAVLLFVAALVLLLAGPGGAAVAAGVLAALSTFGKPQHLILLPPLLAFIFYLSNRTTYRRVAIFLAALAIGLAASYGLLLWLQRDFSLLLGATVHKHRIWQVAMVFTQGFYLLGMFFTVSVSFMLCALAWPPSHAPRGHLIMMTLMLTLLVGSYQIAIISTLGMYALMLLAVPLLVAAQPAFRHLLLFSLFSFAGTAYWSLSGIGDITRLVTAQGLLGPRLAQLKSPVSDMYYSLLTTGERAFVLVMMLCAVWSAVVLMRRRVPPSPASGLRDDTSHPAPRPCMTAYVDSTPSSMVGASSKMCDSPSR